jgi:ribosomal protein S18 acetylase RimI-like enzyme
MTSDDELMPFVVAAMNWRDDDQWTPESVLASPEVSHYIVGWMRAGDGGVVVHCDGVPAGAAWWRTFTREEPGYGFVADDVPEVGLAVLEPYRRKGYARALMISLMERVRVDGVRSLSLSVEDGNHAARSLYESLGFAKVGRKGDSDTLMLQLC